jgi:hypothetical protein
VQPTQCENAAGKASPVAVVLEDAKIIYFELVNTSYSVRACLFLGSALGRPTRGEYVYMGEHFPPSCAVVLVARLPHAKITGSLSLLGVHY